MGDLEFNEWFTVFLEEKGLSEAVVEFDDPENKTWVYMSIQIIQEHLAICSPQMQAKFKSKIVELDFCNMNIVTFLEYIARGIEKMRVE